MSNVAIVPQKNIYSFDELMKLAQILANSSLAPKSYRGKPEDTFIAMEMGIELGLKPFQSVQNIEVINGKAAIYGDALIGLVQFHPAFEDIKEYFDEELQGFVCKVKRKNQSEHTVIFSIDDAKKAGLWNKHGPWQQYPKRMLQMRARGFALRDKFSDALKGLITVEEAQDYPIDVTQKPQVSKSQTLNERLDSLIDTKLIDTKLIDTKLIAVVEEVIEITENASRDKLLQLVKTHEVPADTINKWCEKAGVFELEMLEDNNIINSLINHVEEKYITKEVA